MMLALVASAPNVHTIESIREPSPGPDDVLVRVDGCTICGSDIKLLAGRMDGVAFPLVPGHEWSGTVTDAGANARSFVGRRVVADILQSCGQCRACRDGHRQHCVALIEPGLTTQGAFAELIAVPVRTVRLLPEALTLRQACLVEPLSVTLAAFGRQPAQQSDRVVVIGGGGIGQLMLQVLRLHGLDRIALVDPHEGRRKLASRLGAAVVAEGVPSLAEKGFDALGGPPTVVYHAASRAVALSDAIEIAAPRGRICVVGYTYSEATPVRPSDIMVKMLDIRGALSPTADLGKAMALLATGHVDADLLITHDLPLTAFDRALQLAATRSDRAVRVRVVPNGTAV